MHFPRSLLGLALVVLSSSTRSASAETSPKGTATRLPLQLLVAASATALTSPLVLSAAGALGTATPYLVTSALPALALAVTAPPAIATSALFLERRRGGASMKVGPTFVAAFAAEVLVLAGAILARTWVSHTEELFLLSAVQGAVVGFAATLAAELGL